MKNIEFMTTAAVHDGKASGYVKWCDDCEGVMLFDRYALTEYLTEKFGGWGENLAEKWDKIEEEFVRKEALLHTSGVVHKGKVVEPIHGPVEEREDFELVCGKCYDQREQDAYHEGHEKQG